MDFKYSNISDDASNWNRDIKQLKDNPDTVEDENLIFGKALMLGIAYKASIGGIATLIGTPPNLVLVGSFNLPMDMKFPFWNGLVLDFQFQFYSYFCWVYLTRRAFKFKQTEFPGGKKEILRLKNDLGPIRRRTLGSCSFFVGCFLLDCPFISFAAFISKKLTTLIAILFGLALFVIPSKRKGQPLLNWKDTINLPWGIILLFGGGMALAKAFEESGLAIWLGQLMTEFGGLSLFLLLLLLIAAINFLTEITSNLATTAMLLPVLAPLALEIDVHPFGLSGWSCGCGFLCLYASRRLHPNAVVFGSGYLRIPDMVSKGTVMNIVSILFISLMVYFLLPLLWGGSILNPFLQH